MKDRLGHKYGMLTVMEQYYEDDKEYCVFKCDCGNTVTRRVFNFSFGRNENCGCIPKVNPTVSRRHHPLYPIWRELQRYSRYYHVGICKEWLTSFEVFCQDIGPQPEGMVLGRIDPSQDFCRDNCHWITKAQQSINNGRASIFVEIDGVSYSLRQLSEMSRIDLRIIAGRYHNLGWRGMDLIKPYTKHKKHKHRPK